MDNRLLIVSNRLPITARVEHDALQLQPATGGLATGLGPWHAKSHGLWIGWPGDVSGFSEVQRDTLANELRARAIVPVHLSREDIEQYYHGFSNRVLWPLFHYLIDRVPVDASGWEAYRRVNEIFADVVVREYRADDTIWVHDYQLMLVPTLVRERLPNARIGFFLHIPFPSSEVFRILPWRRDVLRGLLGADLLGFHTFAYMRHFLASLLHVDSVEADIDCVHVGDRDVKLGVFPMGIDTVQFATLARDADVIAQAENIRRDAGGRKILLGVDRLDYTKGIPRRLQAVERLLARDTRLCDSVRYIQVAVPSRGEMDSYQKFKRQVEQGVGRINGACGTLRSTPVHYIQRCLSMRELVALYRAADVMLVTPLRDGMNLVAKEFVASRGDEDGILVLSEFAGAAAELDGALTVNPYDVEAVADSIQRALLMPVGERRARMKTLLRRVREHDVHIWARGFLQELDARRPSLPSPSVVRPEPSLMTAIARARQTGGVRLLLDYDGTLVPLARSPELASPDDDILDLLERLAACPELQVEIVSGRPRETVALWFGHLPITLWAEHGFWYRSRPEEEWRAATTVAAAWMARIRPILEQFTVSTPGSRLEIKSAAMAWHFRGSQRDFGGRQAHELRMLLGDALSNQPVEVLEGKKVIEVRFRGISKAVLALDRHAAPTPRTIVAFGDDRTDEDLFRALPRSSITVSVGRRLMGARYHVESHHAVRQLLRTLVLDSEPVAAGGGDRKMDLRSRRLNRRPSSSPAVGV
jgi:trehalose 6-phosphate synthase/phosphatase